jgi:hypothetical protein
MILHGQQTGSSAGSMSRCSRVVLVVGLGIHGGCTGTYPKALANRPNSSLVTHTPPPPPPHTQAVLDACLLAYMPNFDGTGQCRLARGSTVQPLLTSSWLTADSSHTVILLDRPSSDANFDALSHPASFVAAGHVWIEIE